MDEILICTNCRAVMQRLFDVYPLRHRAIARSCLKSSTLPSEFQSFGQRRP